MNIDVTTLALDWVMDYGAPMVALILLLGGMGLPLPSVLIVIAAGAFMRQELLNMYTTPLLGLIGVVIGDTFVYSMGRFASHWIERRFGASEVWKNAQRQFDKRGGIAIYLSRWLITPIAMPINLIAGGSRYSWGRFFLFDISGEVTWLLLFGGIGYAFGDQWSLITDFVSNFSGLIAGIFVVGVGIYLLIRYSRTTKIA